MTATYYNLWGFFVPCFVFVTHVTENEKRSEALEATQLYLRLLLPNVREELRWLLTFMATASEPNAYKLQKQVKRIAITVLQSSAILF